MFLNVLSKEEKLNFSKLLEMVAKVDGVFSESEKNQINVYLIEMGLTNENIPLGDVDIDELVNKFTNSNEKTKKAIFIELVALVFADGEYSENEKVCIENIQNKFDFSEEYKNEIISWVNEITPLYSKGFKLAGIL